MSEAQTHTTDEPVLGDLRVLELGGGVAAAMATRFLHGYGARVTRFEPTDVADPVPLTASQRLAYLSGIDVVAGPASELAGHLASADMIVTDRQPSELTLLGLDFEALRSDRPELIVVSVTPFGLSGPNADLPTTNAVSFAAGGIMSLTGAYDRTPLVTGGNHAYALGAANAFAAATTAWFGRARSGSGDLVDISLQECAAGMLEYYGPMASYVGTPPPGQLRLGNQSRATWGIYPCLDGWAGVFALARQVPALFALMEDPELAEPRFADPALRAIEENEEELAAKLYVFFAGLTIAEIRELSLRSRVPFGVVMTPADVLAGETPADRGFWDEVADDADSNTATRRIPGRPFPGFEWDCEASPTKASRANAATSGGAVSGTAASGGAVSGTAASGGAVSGNTAASPTPAAGNLTARSTTELPLAGVRVLDLTMMWAGPFATLRLAEMGADVIKVESPSAWDNIRTLIPQEEEPPDRWNGAFYFNTYNRDKRSLTLDLAQPAGRDLLLQLVDHCDVVIENYRSDVLDNLGLGFETLRSRKPDISLISMAAFGKTGADAAFVGFGPVIETMSGLASLTGYGDGEPFKTGISYGDPVAGTFAVAAVGLALKQRMATGRGVHVDLAQRETAAVLIGEAYVDAADGSAPVHRGNRDATMAPQGCYRVQGDERWLVLTVRDDGDWASLCSTIERPDLAVLTVTERRARHDEIDAAINEWLATAPTDPEKELHAAGVPAIEMRNTSTLLDDPHLVARNFWHTTPHPRMHSYRQPGVPWRFADARPEPRRHSPLFGEHNREILHGLLGVTDAELEDLADSNVIADAPINPSVG